MGTHQAEAQIDDVLQCRVVLRQGQQRAAEALDGQCGVPNDAVELCKVVEHRRVQTLDGKDGVGAMNEASSRRHAHGAGRPSTNHMNRRETTGRRLPGSGSGSELECASVLGT